MLKDEAVLLDIARFCQEVIDLTYGMDRDDFTGDRTKQLAVLYEIAVLGEAVKRLSMEFREAHPEIPWKEIAGMRDKVIHQYDRVKVSVVWQAVKIDVPTLLESITPLLPREI
ncbi:MAG: DUF86 domain-containing protein [Pseudanabaena sp. ELA607]|jgi:uncharacterized protein with HEPN domain